MEVKEKMESMESLREVMKIQASPGNIDQGPYMVGFYNGMELALSIFEKREPVFRDDHLKEEKKQGCKGGCKCGRD